MKPFDVGWVSLMFAVCVGRFVDKADLSWRVAVAGPSFSIAIQSDVSTVYPWETAKMECSLSISGSSPKTGTTQHTLTHTHL